MRKQVWLAMMGCAVLLCMMTRAMAESTQQSYFAHRAAVDRYGVIAPWYKGLNGQLDFRVQVAAQTLKRYPWLSSGQAVSPAPAYLYDSKWSVDSSGKITIVPQTAWNNGDLGQRAAVLLGGMVLYYQYSGDPFTFGAIRATADYLIHHCETSGAHGWPHMLISVPNSGVTYRNCRLEPNDVLSSAVPGPPSQGHGKIQLDIVAQVGLQLVRASEMTGNREWYDAAKHWADLLAANRRHGPLEAPWGRYADNAHGRGMNGIQGGGIVQVLRFFDELIRTGYTGPDNSIVAARNEGNNYLKSVLLPAWTVNDTFGRDYWDWEDPVQSEVPTVPVVVYLMDHKAEFPLWKEQVQNILGLFFNHTSVNPASNGDTYNGAWAYPESSDCCDRSLSYPAQRLGPAFALYSVEARSEWAREIVRRSEILTTYDALPDGQAMDDIDGGSPVDGSWFKIAQIIPLFSTLKAIGWLPGLFGPSRENHIASSSDVVTHVVYGKGDIRYQTAHAGTGSVDVLRLAFEPNSVEANGEPLHKRTDLGQNGYTVRELTNGDAVVAIRHDGANRVEVKGTDPQTQVSADKLSFQGSWQHGSGSGKDTTGVRSSSQAGAGMSYAFVGNQVRIFGTAGKQGGLAAVYLDGQRQLTPIDCYSPKPMNQQVLYTMNGLANQRHTVKVVVEQKHNPLSTGTEVSIAALQYSDATGSSGYGSGGGPKGTQRMIFGYIGRKNYVDPQGNVWRPGTEFIVRSGHLTDSVAKAWWTMRQATFITGTKDPELYRYGVHAPEFTVNVTVGPGAYYVRLKFAETRFDRPAQRPITIDINGKRMVSGLDVYATAGRKDKAVDLVYSHIQPRNGIIAIRLVGTKVGGCERDAMVQAIEVGPGDGGTGAQPKLSPAN